MPKLEFTEAYWNQATSIFEGVQVLESKEVGRTIKYYAFPSKEGVPIIVLHDDEEKILKDRKLHKRVIGEIINKVTEELQMSRVMYATVKLIVEDNADEEEITQADYNFKHKAIIKTEWIATEEL